MNGDSGNPMFIIVNDQPVLLTVWTSGLTQRHEGHKGGMYVGVAPETSVSIPLLEMRSGLDVLAYLCGKFGGGCKDLFVADTTEE